MSNPLLHIEGLPPFSQIKPEHIQPAIQELIEENRQAIEQVLKQPHFTWENFIEPLSEAGEHLSRAWSPISHLNSVKNSPKLRDAYQACLPLLSEYTLRDFELSGIGLSEEKQKRYGEIVARLSELSAQFSNNVLDATMGWEKVIEDESELAGLPESALLAAKQSAESKGLKGYRFTLEIPSYLPIMTYCENAALREEMYRAYATRASDQGPNAGKWDNTAIIEEIMTLRVELAKLLGFNTYTERSLATKMAENPQQVLDFLNNLAYRSKAQGEKFYSEKQKQHLYAINDEELRPYFPEDRVISGLFELIKRIFNIRAVERFGVDTWHKDVRFFDLIDETDEVRGSFYLDLYARENKRGGAWMDDCIGRKRNADGSIQKPVAYLTCNFNAPIGDKPALFTHDEVTTLFHEFGHGIHHMLTKVDVPDVAGINGVPWDAVELPSQFMENWCWEKEALDFISGHFETHEPLPEEKLNQLLKAKNYQAAMFVLRQLEFGLFDFTLHHTFEAGKANQVLDTLKAVKDKVAVIKGVEWARAPHSFSHIFAGGYAAGYYSYLWAEVLSADAFSRFGRNFQSSYG